jgi:asparagine synthase (glutamine-hydrolysing)
LSGIGAVFHKNGRPVSRGELNRLASGLRPFGRIYQAVGCLGAAGLVYAHAGNSPQSPTDRQPVSDSTGVLYLVFDGRLDNRDELCSTLRISNHDAKFWPDSRIALRAWEKWGEHAPEYWEGEFAVLVWNARAQILTGVRDQLGDRALSYHETQDRIVVASAPRALFALGDITKEIDEQKLADSLVQLEYDGARSFFKGISRLTPGHRLIVTSDRTRFERYWTLDNVSDVRLNSDDQYVEAAAELLSRSIKACLRRNGPVGAFMSGGLDSSTVAVSALLHLDDQDKLPTFTSVPVKDWDKRCLPGVYGDETPFVEAIAAMHPRLDPTFVRSEGHGLFHQLDEFLDYSGVAPRNAINLFWFHDIYLEAQTRGLQVLLEGDAGNMSLSWDGRGILLEHLKNRDFRMLIQELFAGKFNSRIFFYRLVKMLLLPLAPDFINAAWLRVRGHTNALPLWHKCSAINPEFAREMRIDERLNFYGFDYFMKPVQDTRKFRILLLNDGSVNEKADIYQGFRALYGIETRDPLNNRRLIEWCLGLPESQFRRMGRDRWLVKRLMKDKLPPCVLHNTQGGQQGSDWHYRMTQDLSVVRQELAAIADDPDTSRYIDVKRIKSFLDDWPSETPLKYKPGHTYSYIPIGIGAALAAGRFVRRTKGANR